MPALIVVSFTPVCEESLKQYIASVPDTLVRYDGKFLVRGKSESLSGKADYEMLAILEFSSMNHARDWYYSLEYQALIPVRDKGMISKFDLVDF